ncbi:hypothetical protein K458DRAFT_411002 [Lentithecium fluviatile CBS 122367]|uniref:Uncharacterized protein n=1 Tax=Lentithecium fluviatile CBS 122367 TaxID=1168545 RepID=A0A6G1ICX2_9PLEO|nr:hypothetical protein K458DRAFT_411002 [Lentithecium fluviatile CBS 122367]
MPPITRITLSLFALAAITSAFDVKMYTSKNCAGTIFGKTLNVNDGCTKYGAGVAEAIILPWRSEQDNDQLLVTYSDDNCCHASKIEAYGWSDECIPFTHQAVKSWRVVDPIVDPDRGRADQVEDYTCQRCGTDQCGTIAQGLIPNLPRDVDGEDDAFTSTLPGR